MRFVKNIFLIGAIGLGLGSCSTDDSADLKVVNDDYVRVPITLNIGIDHGLQLSSRYADDDDNYDWSRPDHMPRRLLDWGGAQCVDDLRLYVFQSDTKDGQYLYCGGGECVDGSYLVSAIVDGITIFNNATPVKDDYEEHVYAFTPQLKKGSYYKILAIARDDILGTTPPSGALQFVKWGTRTLSDAEFVVGQTEFHEAYINNMLEESQFPYITTEVFSGTMKFTNNNGNQTEDYLYVSDDVKGFQKSVDLHRLVAGLWVNITDIPALLADEETNAPFVPRELLIIMPYSQSQINTNGTTSLTAQNIRLEKRIGYENFSNDEGEFAGSDKIAQWRKSDDELTWQRSAIHVNGLKIGANCSFMSNFLIPVDASSMLGDNETTMKLHLCNMRSGNHVSFNIKCVIKEVTNPVTGETYTYDGDAYHYPILPNCLYTIGTPDEPLSLSGIKVLSRGGTPEIEMQCTPLR